MHREFVCVNDPAPEINAQQHPAFLMHLQQAVVLSLEHRDLLTASQRERCIAELEKQFRPMQKNKRQA